jgi:hypothetical protein
MARVKRIEITANELLEALNEASRPKITENPPGFFVVSELSAETGVCVRVIMGRLRVAESADRVERIMVWRERSDGRRAQVPAYRITPEKKKAQR